MESSQGSRSDLISRIAGMQDQDVYRELHWEGDFDENFTEFINTADFDVPYVVYCMSENCEDSHLLAERMKGAGFSIVLVFREGFPGWKKASKPIVAGPEKASSEKGEGEE